MGGGTTPTSGDAAGSMNTFGDYQAQLDQQQKQNQIGSAIQKGTSQFGKSSGGSSPQVSTSIPSIPMTPIPSGSSTPQPSPGPIPTPNQGIDLVSALQRLFIGA